MSDREAAIRHERDYIERTIETVRNHRGADNCWPQWANIFADEIEACWAELASVRKRKEKLREALRPIVREYDLWAEDANDGEFRLWDLDRLCVAIVNARALLADGEGET